MLVEGVGLGIDDVVRGRDWVFRYVFVACGEEGGVDLFFVRGEV